MAKKPSADLTWDEAILRVLNDEKAPLHYAEIANLIIERNLKGNVGATPAASVAATLRKSISVENSDIQKVGRGIFTLRSSLLDEGIQNANIQDDLEQDSESGAIRAFGMYWKYDSVLWTGRVKILGRQEQNAVVVDFAEQVGIYLLHDRDRVIYVGRASEGLAPRLKAHTIDRLAGRWDRFSWFGLRSVTEDGKLADPAAAWKHHDVIDTMEAILIECLEPPKNRRGGDRFADVEFQQLLDPNIEAKQEEQLLTRLLNKKSDR
jgi:hypothetical protein